MALERFADMILALLIVVTSGIQVWTMWSGSPQQLTTSQRNEKIAITILQGVVITAAGFVTFREYRKATL